MHPLRLRRSVHNVWRTRWANSGPEPRPSQYCRVCRAGVPSHRDGGDSDTASSDHPPREVECPPDPRTPGPAHTPRRDPRVPPQWRPE